MSNTFEGISKRMKGRLLYGASRIEGSWTADNIQAVANELARIYAEDIETILDKAFVATSYGEWADLACGDYGVVRNQATSAVAYLEVDGQMGRYEPMEVAADDIVFETEAFYISDTGTAVVKAVCKEAGSHGNVLAECINKVLGNRTRISRITNPEAAKGGFDRETDGRLIARTLEKIRMPPTSGNVAHYRQWALEVTGVEKVKVFPLARGKGTVDVIIIADGNALPPDILIQKVADHIEECRPIGADVLIEGAEPVEVNMDATVLAVSGSNGEDISRQMRMQMENYFKAFSFDNYKGFEGNIVSYLKIADLLFNCEGIKDVTSYRINGRENSMKLTDRQFPVPGTVVITLGGT